MRAYKVKPIQSVSRAFEVLEVLQDLQAASLHELHHRTHIPKATLLRVLVTAHEHGLVWQRMVDGAFVHSFARQPLPDDEEWLVEVASPVLAALAEEVGWPSVLAVPRRLHMETVESNGPRAYVNVLRPRARGYRVNMLRSATGRAYLANVAEEERQRIVEAVIAQREPGWELAQDRAALDRVLRRTRRQGFGTRAADFGGHYEKDRTQEDDGRQSVAMPIRRGGQVVACLNITWLRRVASTGRIMSLHGPRLRQAVATIEARLIGATGHPSA